MVTGHTPIPIIHLRVRNRKRLRTTGLQHKLTFMYDNFIHVVNNIFQIYFRIAMNRSGWRNFSVRKRTDSTGNSLSNESVSTPRSTTASRRSGRSSWKSSPPSSRGNWEGKWSAPRKELKRIGRK